MTRQRLYNPAHLTPDELKEGFVAREDTLAEMLRLIREQTPGRPCQHMMLIGPRGMGKTTLGLRFLYAIEDNPELRDHWQPVAFHEESYGIVNLADFWIHALRHLTRTTGEGRWEERADSLEKDDSDMKRLAAYALDALMDFNEESGKRLILFVENIDAVLGQIHDEREIHMLRATLIERPEILLLGSANAFFEAIGGYGQPLYEFFRILKLVGIGQEDARRILKATADREGRPEVPEALNREHGRLETIRRLTGGNPRLLVLACRMLIESPLGSPVEDLERLIDEQTPYFKARIEELPAQARKVFHCLSAGWRPLLAKEVAGAAKLSSSHASAQLKQLLERGYVREVRLPAAKRTRYEVSDRFYNIYYLLRFSRTGRERLERLVAFLHDLFGPSGMRTMYPATLASLRNDGIGTQELSELLGVLAGHVARDTGFGGRDDWRNQAVAIVVERIGPDAPVMEEIVDAFSGQAHRKRFQESILETGKLVGAGRFLEAEGLLQEFVEYEPHNAFAWLMLGSVLVQQDRYEAALVALERAADCGRPDYVLGFSAWVRALKGVALLGIDRDDEAIASFEQASQHDESPEASSFGRLVAAFASMAAGMLLANSDRYEDAAAALQRSSEHVRPDDAANLRGIAVASLAKKGDLLAKMDRDEEAICARLRVDDFVLTTDSEELRQEAVRALSENGYAQVVRDNYERAVDSWERMTGYVCVSDSAGLRHDATIAVLTKGMIVFLHGEQDGLAAACRFARAYIRHDDPPELRRSTAKAMSGGGNLLISIERYDSAEFVFGMTTDVDPDLDESWSGWADAILFQGDDARLSEAEQYARRAVELGPDNPNVLLTFSDVLARRGSWAEALDQVERSVRIGGKEFLDMESGRLTELLIQASVAGRRRRVKEMMAESTLAERLEPLWHAVRVELGEELEPLPAEVMDAAMEVRRRISGEDESERDPGRACRRGPLPSQ